MDSITVRLTPDLLQGKSPEECWVWEQIAYGKIADFNQKGGCGGILTSKNSDGWTEKRILSKAFIEGLLTMREANLPINRYGIRITAVVPIYWTAISRC